jgi:hypothetical protein
VLGFNDCHSFSIAEFAGVLAESFHSCDRVTLLDMLQEIRSLCIPGVGAWAPLGGMPPKCLVCESENIFFSTYCLTSWKCLLILVLKNCWAFPM